MPSTLQITEPVADGSGISVLVAQGVLDGSTYHGLRDSVVKAALAEPRAVVVDVTALLVPASSAWAVFTSARWHVSTWPDVPVVLVCAHGEGREAIKISGITRYVPVHTDVGSAVLALDDDSRPTRRRARAELAPVYSSVRRSRRLVSDWLSVWSLDELIPVAATVTTVFTENAVTHTVGAFGLLVENSGDLVTVAVEDASVAVPQRREDPLLGADIVSGLAIVAALCRRWGTSSTPNGKTVWAIIGPENRL
jgi:anti-anti-sigma factor